MAFTLEEGRVTNKPAEIRLLDDIFPSMRTQVNPAVSVRNHGYQAPDSDDDIVLFLFYPEYLYRQLRGRRGRMSPIN